MYILCDKTSIYYSRLKNIINIPIIICSTSMSILNTTEFSKEVGIDNVLVIRLCTIIFNLMTALSIAVLNVYKITEKEFSFKSLSISFLKVHNKINMEIAKHKSTKKNIENEIINLIKEYNTLCESVIFHIPEHIQNNVKKNYESYHLPFMPHNNKMKLNQILLVNASGDSIDVNIENSKNSPDSFSSNMNAGTTSVDSSSSNSLPSPKLKKYGSFNIKNKIIAKRRRSSTYKNSPLRALTKLVPLKTTKKQSKERQISNDKNNNDDCETSSWS